MFCSIASSVTQARATSHRCCVSANIVSDDQCHGNEGRLHSPVRHAVLLRSNATAVLPSSVFLKESLRRWATPLRSAPSRGREQAGPGASQVRHWVPACGGGGSNNGKGKEVHWVAMGLCIGMRQSPVRIAWHVHNADGAACTKIHTPTYTCKHTLKGEIHCGHHG